MFLFKRNITGVLKTRYCTNLCKYQHQNITLKQIRIIQWTIDRPERLFPNEIWIKAKETKQHTNHIDISTLMRSSMTSSSWITCHSATSSKQVEKFVYEIPLSIFWLLRAPVWVCNPLCECIAILKLKKLSTISSRHVRADTRIY